MPMPGPWLAFGALLPGLFSGSYPQLPAIQTLDEEVVVIAKSQRRDMAKGTIEFSDGVTVLYGPTKITANRVIYTDRPGERSAIAEGKVALDDPEGSLSAEKVVILWLPTGRTATAENIEADLAGANIRAKTLDIKPTLWTLTDVYGTTCTNRPPLFEIFSKKVTFVPGQRGSIHRPVISILGRRIGAIPSYGFNLDRRAQGIGIPSVAFSGDQGFGVSWAGSVLIDRQSGLGASFGSFERAFPTYNVTYTRGFVPANETNALLVPRNELGERFNFGWFDTVEVPNPQADTRFLTERRSSMSVSSSINQGAANFVSDRRFNKPLELVYEASGPAALGPAKVGGAYAQARLQSIGTQDVRSTVRGIVTTSFAPPNLSLTKQLQTVVRFDQAAFLGKQTYGWLRSQVGLAYQPNQQLYFGAALVGARDFGKPAFLEDSLMAGDGIHLRAGLNLGGTRIEYLYKRDRRLGWYDREWSINQAVGCLEFYMMRRQVPIEYRVGIKVRVDQFVDLLQRRKLQRTKPVTKTVISGEEK